MRHHSVAALVVLIIIGESSAAPLSRVTGGALDQKFQIESSGSGSERYGPSHPDSSSKGGGPALAGGRQEGRLAAVRRAAQQAWVAYEKFALGSDELRPVNRTGSNSLGGLGATVVESLSALWMMGLTEEFQRARDWVARELTFDKPANISLFETIIRLSGGLISAYDLSGDALFLERATDLATRLAPAFHVCTETGIPDNRATLPVADRGNATGPAVLAELGSATLEWGALSLRGGNDTYRRLAERPIRLLWRQHPGKGLLTDLIERSTGEEASDRLSIGAGSDSTYEYLLKYWLLMGKQDDWWRRRWVAAMDEAVARLVQRAEDGSLVWVADHNTTTRATSNNLEHLACFWPGNLVLGVLSGAVEGQRAALYAEVAAAVTQACYQLYSRSPTGLSWDVVHVSPRNGTFTPHPTWGRAYVQRPEVLESIFFMYRLTGDPMYQTWGWRIFLAMQQHSRVPGSGFTGLLDAGQVPPRPDDQQQSWILAETFKYLYLLFAGDGALSLEEYVLTTEAHPLRAQQRPGTHSQHLQRPAAPAAAADVAAI